MARSDSMVAVSITLHSTTTGYDRNIIPQLLLAADHHLAYVVKEEVFEEDDYN